MNVETPSKKKEEYWINGDIKWNKSERCHDHYIPKANEYITKLALKNLLAKILR